MNKTSSEHEMAFMKRNVVKPDLSIFFFFLLLHYPGSIGTIFQMILSHQF